MLSDSEDDDEQCDIDDGPAKRKIKKQIRCIYCWSRKTLTDICVKTMKSFGFFPPKKDSLRIPIASLTRDRIKKLGGLRVIQKSLVYVIGLSPDLAREDKIASIDYFG